MDDVISSSYKNCFEEIRNEIFVQSFCNLLAHTSNIYSTTFIMFADSTTNME